MKRLIVFIVILFSIVVGDGGSTGRIVTAEKEPCDNKLRYGTTEIAFSNTETAFVEIGVSRYGYCSPPLVFVSLVNTTELPPGLVEVSGRPFGGNEIILQGRLDQPWTGNIDVNWMVVPNK